MKRPRVVIDTSVIYAGLGSRRGASFRLLQLVADGAIEPALSVPLFLEYEHTTSRLPLETALTPKDVATTLNFLVSVAHLQDVYFSWRPTLPDPNDDFILELAVAASSRFIVTFNLRDFRGAESFGITVLTPGVFVSRLRSFP